MRALLPDATTALVSGGPSRLARVALAVALAVLVLLVGEGIARYLDLQASYRSLHALRPDAPWLYDLVPGAVGHDPLREVEYRIASHGFRDHERSRKKAANVFRVAVLGDSVTFGFGVSREDGFVARTEAALAAAASEASPRAQIEVLNFGVSGYNPYNEVELFRGVVREFEPDLTLVQFCVNDLNDPRHHFGASTAARLGELPELAFPNPERARDTTWKVSAIASACDRSSLCRLLLGNVLAPARRPADPTEVRETFELRSGPEFAQEWAWLRQRYVDLAQSARQSGSDFGVVVFPHAAELEVETPSAGAVLRRMGEEEGWVVVDLTGAFRDTGEKAQVLFFDIWHPTPIGHRVAGEALARAIRAHRSTPVGSTPREP